MIKELKIKNSMKLCNVNQSTIHNPKSKIE